MPRSSKRANALRATRSMFLALPLAALLAFAFPLSHAQEQAPRDALRGYVPPPPERGAQPQPLPAPLLRAPGTEAPQQEEGPSRPPFTVFPPPEMPYAIDLADLGLRIVSSEEMDSIRLPAGDPRPPLAAGRGQRLVAVTLEGKVPHPRRVPIAIQDFSAFWEAERSKDLYGKNVTERVVQVIRAAALETQVGWLVAGPGVPEGALFFFMEAKPFTLRVAFLLPVAVTRFGVRFPHVAEGEGKLPRSTPPTGMK